MTTWLEDEFGNRVGVEFFGSLKKAKDALACLTNRDLPMFIQLVEGIDRPPATNPMYEAVMAQIEKDK